MEKLYKLAEYFKAVETTSVFVAFAGELCIKKSPLKGDGF